MRQADAVDLIARGQVDAPGAQQNRQRLAIPVLSLRRIGEAFALEAVAHALHGERTGEILLVAEAVEDGGGALGFADGAVERRVRSRGQQVGQRGVGA